jgi:hypothetical protein
MSPGNPNDFREHAANCERMAAKSKDTQVRQTFLNIASKWRALAAADELPRPFTNGKALSVEHQARTRNPRNG